MTDDLIPRKLLEHVARRFQLLAEPARLELLNLLHARGEAHQQALVEASGQSQAGVSRHLRLLADEGLIARRREGSFTYYRIADPMLAALCALVCGRLTGD